MHQNMHDSKFVRFRAKHKILMNFWGEKNIEPTKMNNIWADDSIIVNFLDVNAVTYIGNKYLSCFCLLWKLFEHLLNN